MVEVHGFCDERFGPLGDLFRAGFERGTDEGAALAVSMNGELVVDLYGGYRDLAHTKPWERDTLVLVSSISKVIVTISTLMLWDRGRLDLDEPIATYWPEFAQNGKDAITTRQVLVHSAGLPGFGLTPAADDWRSWDRMIAIVEAAPVWYEPGTTTCYHSETFGYLLGELVHRISASPIDRFVSEEITGPLDADFHYTLNAARDLTRVAEVRPPEGEPYEMKPMGTRVFAEEAELWPLLLTRELMRSVIPSAGGMANARALVRVGSIMARRGDVDGRRYLSPERVDEAVREQSYAEDQVHGWIRRGLFFGLHSDAYPSPTPTTIHWGGFGGSWLIMDPASGISCAYTPNRFLVGDDGLFRQAGQWQVLTEVLRDPR